ncbi:MAG TPA: acetyl-CoA acetyltransferase [Chloroflexota bacterium]|nr:acetyl-CoA acetyltransferase [Chloroflexota bacterium]
MTYRPGTAVVVGVAESDEIGVLPHKMALQLHAEAARNALAEAGVAKDEVDGLFTAGLTTSELGEYLGISPTYTDGTHVGGASFVIHLGHAAAAIAAGLCHVALISHGQSGRSRQGAPMSPLYGMNQAQFEAPFGLPAPVGAYALATARHMHQYGTTHEQLAEIAVATRKWAAMNPRALMREPITIEDVLNSRWISWPLHLLDCCLVTDAGGAAVITSAARARHLRTAPVGILGFGEYHDHSTISQMPDLTSGPGRVSGARAFAMAGIRPNEIDVAEIYDSFTYTVLLSLEDLGFCAKGEGGAFVAGQRTAPGGAFPMNTQGGGLSYTHPGMFGIFTIIEAVRQLRGDYAAAGQLDRQVTDAKLALVHGTGGVLSATGTAVLGI